MPEVRGHSRVEEALDVGAVPFTVLRRQLFMDDLLGPARRAVSSGTLYSNSARSRWVPIAVRDFAAVVAVVLTTNGHEGRFYSITGPELINAPEVGEMVAGVTGRRVSVIDLPDSQWIERAVARGVPEAMAQA